QFLVVALATTEDVILFRCGKLLEALQVMHPLLQDREAAPILAGSTTRDDRRLEGRLIKRILGAILVARQVTSLLVTESLHHLNQGQRRREDIHDLTSQPYQLATLLATQPAPEGLLRGRHLCIGFVEVRKFPQPVDPSAQRLDQRLPQPDHHLPAIRQPSQSFKRGRQVRGRAKGKQQVTRVKRNRGLENGRLKTTHDLSCKLICPASLPP